MTLAPRVGVSMFLLLEIYTSSKCAAVVRCFYIEEKQSRYTKTILHLLLRRAYRKQCRALDIRTGNFHLAVQEKNNREFAVRLRFFNFLL